jgi:hydrogenase maturation protease
LKIWLAGFGNEHREDDGAGPVLARRIAGWLRSEGEDVALSLEHQLLPELVEEMNGVDLALFADASMEMFPSGWRLEEIQPDPTPHSLNIHSMGPQWLFALARILDSPPRLALLISISGSSFNFAPRLSRPCRRVLPRALEGFKAWFRERGASLKGF